MPGFVPNVIMGSSAAASIAMLLSNVAPSSVGKLPPARDGRVPVGAFRSIRAACHILIGRVVGRDQAGARAAFDRHIADGHALFHRKRADGRAAVFEHAAGSAADADARDQVQNDVLRADAVLQRAVDPHLIGLRGRLQQALRGEHMLDLAGADAERQRAESAMGCGVAVAANDGHARLRQALLGPDDVNDSLFFAVRPEAGNAEIAAVLFQLRRSARRRLYRGWEASGRTSECCDRWCRWSDRDAAPSARARAVPKRLAAKSLHAPGADRYRAASARLPAPLQRGCPKLFR